MSLIVDHRDQLVGQPGVHAFVVGVSAYHHVPGGGGAPTDSDFGLEQLSSCARSAAGFAEWLQKRDGHFAAPLATVRLLLSPSPGETGLPSAQPATRRNFVTAAKEWRNDAASHRKNVAIFFFAGHGFQRTKDDSLMLLHDFGDPAEGILANAADIRSLLFGMSPSPQRPEIGRTQLYIVDACRVRPEAFAQFETTAPPAVLEIPLEGQDDRCAPVFFSAIPNMPANAVPGGLTIFTSALIDCLNGAAGDAVDDPVTGGARWHVTVSSLIQRLPLKLDTLARIHGGIHRFVVGGLVRDAVVHELSEPPMVDLQLTIDPVAGYGAGHFEVKDGGQKVVIDQANPIPNPFQKPVCAGIYQLQLKFTPGAGFHDWTKLHQVKPPLSQVRATVA
jgi:hypothetical protein